eukprot:8302-Pelagococcus_subviridis.AAC.3
MTPWATASDRSALPAFTSRLVGARVVRDARPRVGGDEGRRRRVVGREDGQVSHRRIDPDSRRERVVRRRRGRGRSHGGPAVVHADAEPLDDDRVRLLRGLIPRGDDDVDRVPSVLRELVQIHDVPHRRQRRAGGVSRQPPGVIHSGGALRVHPHRALRRSRRLRLDFQSRHLARDADDVFRLRGVHDAIRVGRAASRARTRVAPFDALRPRLPAHERRVHGGSVVELDVEDDDGRVRDGIVHRARDGDDVRLSRRAVARRDDELVRRLSMRDAHGKFALAEPLRAVDVNAVRGLRIVRRRRELDVIHVHVHENLVRESRLRKRRPQRERGGHRVGVHGSNAERAQVRIRGRRAERHLRRQRLLVSAVRRDAVVLGDDEDVVARFRVQTRERDVVPVAVRRRRVVHGGGDDGSRREDGGAGGGGARLDFSGRRRRVPGLV